MARKKLYKWGQKEETADQEKDKKRPGQCDQCGGGRFSLQIKDRKLSRICHNCGDETDPELEVKKYE